MSNEEAPDKTEKVFVEVKVWTNVQGFSENLEEKGYETAVIATKVRSPTHEESPLHLYQWMDKRRAKLDWTWFLVWKHESPSVLSKENKDKH